MTAALVPAKTLDKAKGRLAALLSEDERRQLALAMLEDLLRTLQGVRVVESVSVVSPDAAVLSLARELGATAIEEPASVRGINQALTHALGTMDATPESLLVMLADVPEATPGDVEALLAALPERGIAICPSPDKGTSALALRPADVIRFHFGEGSFTLHKREAAARGIAAEVVRIESLSRDVDSPEDLRGLLSRPAETATHRLLAALGIAGRT
ncbi:MAG: 2-phospho-L-lactate guanylyltransferase [Dehalococcoidia bacterium]